MLIDKSSTKLCHYTTIDSAGKILANRSIHLSRLDKTNDLAEIKTHEDAKKIFIASFSHSEAKNIPMFYLYSGIDGKGCRIEFTPAKMNSILRNNELYYVNKKYNMLRNPIDKNNYKIYSNWILYLNGNSETGFYRNELRKQQYIEKLRKMEGIEFFLKGSMWKYEAEFRIVVCFKEPQEKERVALSFDISNHERGMSVMCGPEMEDSQYSEIRKEFGEYGIDKVTRMESGKIKMNLVDRNKHLL